MHASLLEIQWIWHPDWSEELRESAGGFVHFRKSFTVESLPTEPLRVRISADTRYKVFINARLVCTGPVKGDEKLWFYDEIDIQPHLHLGTNHINIRVLRFPYATHYATSFPRLPIPGLFVQELRQEDGLKLDTQTDSTWETALDSSTVLRMDLQEDDFLHIYEDVDQTKVNQLNWCPGKVLAFPSSHGLTPPWNLSPRAIPYPRLETTRFKAIHKLESTVPSMDWEKMLLAPPIAITNPQLCLPAGTSHRLELEACHHLTAMLSFRFGRPSHAGSTLRIVYSECYEDEPDQIPYLRRKGDRCDSTKQLMGPEDRYKFGGKMKRAQASGLKYDMRTDEEEIFTPFHFRTLRFLVLEIHVADEADLIFNGIDFTSTNYPLEVRSDFKISSSNTIDNTFYDQLWNTSLRTLENCLHDTYEDCPFYEQLQYAMDTRSSILFTYCVSGDDRLARQAIVQLHNSYQPHLGLTASRAPSHQLQIIPNFSLFWVCMVADHFEYFGDADFVRTFIPACDGVLEAFSRRIDQNTGLVQSLQSSTQWDFVDWTDAWRPMGCPPAAARTGFCSFSSMLYTYCLKKAATVLLGIGRRGMAADYQERALAMVKSIQKHCFDGTFYTDGLASEAILSEDYSQHSQIWAVLCGAAVGDTASHVLRESVLGTGEINGDRSATPRMFAPVSVAMSFYTLRALSLAGGTLYNSHFHSFWPPWKEQLALNLDTWMEDTLSLRSDCHAWGSTALYEFAVEVAGIRPAGAGWKKIAFTPRVGLFPAMDIKVPFGSRWFRGRGEDHDVDSGRGSVGKSDEASRPLGSRLCPSGVAHVRWHTDEYGAVELTLKLEMDVESSVPPPVQMSLPSGSVEEVDATRDVVRIINL